MSERNFVFRTISLVGIDLKIPAWQLSLVMREAIAVVNQAQKEGAISKYAIGGAVGAGFYVEPVSTLDVDFFINTEPVEPGKLIIEPPYHAYFKEKGYNFDPQDHLQIKGILVQFVPANHELEQEGIAQAKEVDIGQGVRAWVMPAEYLIAIALKIGRTKGISRVKEFFESRNYDQDILDSLLKSFGLVEKWARATAK